MAVRVCCGDSVFKASPSAPASSAERSESPSLYAVRTSTLGADGRSRSAAITAVPLMLVSRSEEHTSELQSQSNLVCRLLLEKKKTNSPHISSNHSAASSNLQSCYQTVAQHPKSPSAYNPQPT